MRKPRGRGAQEQKQKQRDTKNKMYFDGDVRTRRFTEAVRVRCETFAYFSLSFALVRFNLKFGRLYN